MHVCIEHAYMYVCKHVCMHLCICLSICCLAISQTVHLSHASAFYLSMIRRGTRERHPNRSLKTLMPHTASHRRLYPTHCTRYCSSLIPHPLQYALLTSSSPPLPSLSFFSFHPPSLYPIHYQLHQNIILPTISLYSSQILQPYFWNLNFFRSQFWSLNRF